MIERINGAIDTYQEQWNAMLDGCNDRTFFDSLTPTSLGWKVGDEADYRHACAQLMSKSDQIVETRMNDRLIAKIHLGDVALSGGIEIVKVMQRRPGSKDATGLDHIDFYHPDMAAAEMALSSEPHLRYSQERNDIIEGYPWLSVWFGNSREAKIKNYTVLDIVQAELAILNNRLKNKKA